MRDRRLGVRIPLDMMLTCYVNDRPLRGLVLDVSDTGIRVEVVAGRAPAPGESIALEIGLPGNPDTLWASGIVCHQRPDDLATGLGVRFAAMASRHARTLREFCLETRHRSLGQLLARVRPPALSFA